MGTRSLTIIEDEQGDPLLTIYRQFDGYPEGHGRILAHFLNGFEVCNGISSYEKPKLANGIGCLAAQIVAHLKRSHRTHDGKRQGPVGNIYIYPNGSHDVGEEYIYRIAICPKRGITMNVWNVWEKREIMRGTPPEIMRAIRNHVRRKKMATAKA